MDSLRDGKSSLVNTNKLIRNYKGATGLKTGSTSLALYNLSASATRDNLSLIAVIMKAPTSNLRFENAKKLLDYGFKSYIYKQFAKKDDVVSNIPVFKGIQKDIDVVFETDAGVLVKKGEEGNVEQNMQIEKSLTAPVEKGQKVGTVEYVLNGNVVATVNIIANSSVQKESFGEIVKYVYGNWFCLLR